MSTTSSSSSGVGVLGLLGVVFVTLKLTGFIDWSWWWVTAPFWGGFGFLATGFLGMLAWLYFHDHRRFKNARRRPY